VIEELLNHKFEVLNFGVRGYGTDQTYLLFITKGVLFSPDVVIYTFCVNDIWDNANPSSKPYFDLDPSRPGGIVLKGYPVSNENTWRRAVSSVLRDHSFTFRRLRELKPQLEQRIANLFRKAGTTSPMATPLEFHFELRPYQKVHQSEDHRRMELTMRILSLLKDFIERRGMKLLVVEGLYKAALQEATQRLLIEIYGDKFDFDKVSTILAEYTRNKQIAFLSLPQQVKEQKIDVSRLMHQEDSVHLNQAGIQFYSRAVVAKMRSLHWITNTAEVNSQRHESYLTTSPEPL
jgi:lysophospholipase L1-like esterase